MRWGLIALALLATTSVARSHEESAVTYVGLDEQGNPVELELPSSRYSSSMKEITSALQASTIEALSHRQGAQPFALRTVMVGVGVSLEAGIGPIIKVKAVPRFRLAFTNNADPILP